MEKYLNAVILDKNVQTMKSHYLEQCRVECTKNNVYFAYGPEYMIKCHRLCMKNNEDFMKKLEDVKAELQTQLEGCYSTVTSDDSKSTKLKTCILPYQQRALNILHQAMDKLQAGLS